MSYKCQYTSYRKKVMAVVNKVGVDSLQEAMRIAEIECKKLISRGQDAMSVANLPPRVLYGTLRSSIDIYTELSKGEPIGWLGVRKSPATAPSNPKAADSAEGYALQLELGTSDRPAHPYLRPTIEHHGPRICASYERNFSKHFTKYSRGNR